MIKPMDDQSHLNNQIEQSKSSPHLTRTIELLKPAKVPSIQSNAETVITNDQAVAQLNSLSDRVLKQILAIAIPGKTMVNVRKSITSHLALISGKTGSEILQRISEDPASWKNGELTFLLGTSTQQFNNLSSRVDVMDEPDWDTIDLNSSKQDLNNNNKVNPDSGVA